MNWLLVITALLKLLPMVLEMVRDGRIKQATTEEVVNAFELEFEKQWKERIDRARAAADTTDSMSNEPDLLDRATSGKKGGAKSSK